MKGNDLAGKIAVILRGLSYNGKRCGFVVYAGEGELPGSAHIDLPAGVREAGDDNTLISAVRDEVSYLFGGTPPSCPLFVGGVGSFAVSASYDAALKTAGLPSFPPKAEHTIDGSQSVGSEVFSDRNLVVRDKVSVVTGGAQGFGEGIVKGLVAYGSVVFIADLNVEGAKSLAESLNKEYGRTVAVPVGVNVTDEASVSAMISEIAQKAGGFDLFVSNAGVLKAASVKDMEVSAFRFVTEVNYTGYFICVKHASRLLSLQNSSCAAAPAGKGLPYFTDIVQINSKSGLEGSNKNGAYAGGKFGGIGLTQSFAMELITDNIKVNSICPGNFFEGPLWNDPEKGLFVQYLNTGKVPGAKTIEEVKRYYESKVPMNRGCFPGDVLKAILYCVEQVYETGQAVPVTGGQVMLK